MWYQKTDKKEALMMRIYIIQEKKTKQKTVKPDVKICI